MTFFVGIKAAPRTLASGDGPSSAHPMYGGQSPRTFTCLWMFKNYQLFFSSYLFISFFQNFMSGNVGLVLSVIANVNPQQVEPGPCVDIPGRQISAYIRMPFLITKGAPQGHR
jgi:hypothetical protein